MRSMQQVIADEEAAAAAHGAGRPEVVAQTGFRTPLNAGLAVPRTARGTMTLEQMKAADAKLQSEEERALLLQFEAVRSRRAQEPTL